MLGDGAISQKAAQKGGRVPPRGNGRTLAPDGQKGASARSASRGMVDVP
jgi:hypothetical protein